MAFVRILIDGYNLLAFIQQQLKFGNFKNCGFLRNWPALAPGAPRHSERARDALAQMLTKYHDATGEAITIFFDGRGAPASAPKGESARGVEILFSRSGQTADDLIERAAHRFQEFGEVLVVTDDVAERDTVSGFGGSVASCANFIRMVETALADLSDDLQQHNRTEQNRFKRK